MLLVIVAALALSQGLARGAQMTRDPNWRREGLRGVHTTPIGDRLPLILVHGFSFSPTLLAESDEWEHFIGYYENAPALNGRFKLYTYNYDPHMRTIAEFADDLARGIDGGGPNREIVDKPVVILAHSMGGLVARHLMNNYTWRGSGVFDGCLGGDRVLRLITLGTPHLGIQLRAWRLRLVQLGLTEVSGLVDRFYYGSGDTNAALMDGDSPFIRSLGEERRFDHLVFPYWSRVVRPRPLQLYRVLAWSIPEWRLRSDGLVPDLSAQFHGHDVGRRQQMNDYDHGELRTGKSSEPYALFDRLETDVVETTLAYRQMRMTARDGCASGTAPHTVLVFDRSFSMSEHITGGTKIEVAKTAAEGLLDLLRREQATTSVEQLAALVTFRRTIERHPETGITANLTSLSRALRDTQADDGRSRNVHSGTNIGDALSAAVDMLPRTSAGRQMIVLLSDGDRTAGPTRGQILAGPVAAAALRGIRIFTIGFNEGQYLDEALMRQIAAETGGEYFNARDAYRLENVYLGIYHSAAGRQLGAYQGTVAQGQTVTAGTFVVPAGTSHVRFTLNWPGSRLDLTLTDPRGAQIVQNYPGATLATEGRPIHVFVRNPLPGRWLAQVTGVDTQAGGEPYDIFASTSAPGVAVDSLGFLPILAIAAVIVTGIGVLSIATRHRSAVRNRRAGRTPFASHRALIVLAGTGGHTVVLGDRWISMSLPGHLECYARATRLGAEVYMPGSNPPQRMRLGAFQSARIGEATVAAWLAPVPPAWLEDSSNGRVCPIRYPKASVGRGQENAIRVAAPDVSRRHARFDWRSGHLLLTDLRSKHGTFVDGTRIEEIRIGSGRKVRFGGQEMLLRVASDADGQTT
jgi:pimeloyl-ACP methyl ester carboxylesterase